MAFQRNAFQNNAFQVGAQSVAVGLVDQTAVAFSPTVSYNQDVAVGLVDQTAVIFSSTVAQNDQNLTLGLIDQTAAAYGPAITTASTVSLGLINQTATASAPTVTSIATVSLGLTNQTASAFAPSIVVVLSLGLISQPASSFAPTITTGPTFITPGLINQTAIARSPLVSITTEVGGGGGTGGPGTSGATSHTRVFIAGLGNVAPIVIWSQSVLETAEGGEASAGVIAIRDVGIDRAEFIPMARVTIDRGAGTDPIYSGYLIKPSRRFFFPVDYPDTLQRMWILNVADINLLWSRRVTYNQSDPADIEGPIYVNDTYDDIALRELFDNWVDLSTDDLDVTTRINRVGLINYDQPAYPFNGGQTLGDAVTTIAQLPAAVYGINSNRQVVYADVDDENAPFVLSDAFIPAVSHPSPVFSTNKNSSTPFYDPQLGTTIIGIVLDLGIDAGDPTEISDWIGEDARVSWLKMVLNTEANLRFDTFGSFVEDTVVFVYQKDGAPGPTDEAIIVADDTNLSYAGNVIWDAPFTYFRLNQVSGSAVDTMAPEVFGAYRNTPLLNQTASPAYSGQVYVRFGQTSVNEYVVMLDNPVLDVTGTSPITYEAWIKWDGTGSGAVATLFGKGTQEPYVWLNTSNGKITLSRADFSDIFTTVSGITANVWYHMVLTYRNNTVAALYLNGVSVPITTPNYTDFVANTQFQCFGSKSDNGGAGENTWRGYMSDVAIYGQILPAATITRHYQQRNGFHSSSPSSLTTYTQFDPGTYWIAVVSYDPTFDPETYVAFKVHRSASDTVYEQGGWEPVGSPGKPNAGYREMTLLEDGTRLCNDIMAWGFGMGAPNGVFRRLKSQASIDEHGLWQDAHVIYSIYKQATINKVADSVINGSPQSKRGQKNDNVSVELVTFEDGLHVGDRVRFISHIWQYEDVIPVRKIEISFPTPNDVRYKFLLSHEIDRWGFQDPLPPFPLPGPYPIPDIPPITIIEPPPVLPPTCVEAVYSVDEFARTQSSSSPYTDGATTPRIWNNGVSPTSDSWLNWVLAPVASGSSATVNTTTRLATATVVSDEFGVRMAYRIDGQWVRDVATAKFRFKLSAIQAGYEVQFTFGAMRVDITPDADTIDVVTGSGTSSDTFSDWGTPGTDFYVLECHLDLENDSVEAHIYREGSASDLVVVARAADGERVGVDDYQPEVGIFWLNSGTAVTFTMSPLRLSVYADANTPPVTSGLFNFTDSEWVEWIDGPNVGDDPGFAFSADGTITYNADPDTSGEGNMRRDLNSGGADVAFCVSDYTTHPTRSEVLNIFFGVSGFNFVHYAAIGNNPYVFSVSNSSVGTTTLFTAGNPVNVRIQISGGSMRLKQWAGGTAEPTAWTSEIYRELEPWPHIILGVYMPFAFNNGESVKLGPLQLDTGESPEYMIPYPDELGYPGYFVDADPPVPHASGRRRSWPFTEVGGYAVPFGDDIYTIATNTLPSYSIGVVWPVFEPDPGDGIPYEINQRIASLNVPLVTHKGVSVGYVVRVRGTVTGVLGEARYEGRGATGVPGPMHVMLLEYRYGTGPAAPGGVPDPGYIDYNILEGITQAEFDFTNVYVDDTGQHHESFDFDFYLDPVQVEGLKYIQWGVYFYGTGDGTIDSIEQAGPLWGGGFLFTPNNCHYQAVISNVTYELAPSALGFPVIQYNPDACQPNPVGYDYGDPESGRICITFTGNGTGDEFDLPKFVPGSADVIVDGYTLTPGTNYTEDGDYLGVTIPIPPPDGSWVLICVTVI